MTLLTACTSVTSGTAKKGPVTDEWRDAVIDSVSKLGTALGPVAAAMTNSNYPALQTACRDLGTYVDTMQRTVLPGPDPIVNSSLQDGINGYRNVSTQCAALSEASSPADLQQLSTTLAGADRRIKDALRLLKVKVPRR